MPGQEPMTLGELGLREFNETLGADPGGAGDADATPDAGADATRTDAVTEPDLTDAAPDGGADAGSEPASGAPTKEPSQVLKLKINGQNVDYDLSDKARLERDLQKGLAADAKFQQASEMEKAYLQMAEQVVALADLAKQGKMDDLAYFLTGERREGAASAPGPAAKPANGSPVAGVERALMEKMTAMERELGGIREERTRQRFDAEFGKALSEHLKDDASDPDVAAFVREHVIAQFASAPLDPLNRLTVDDAVRKASEVWSRRFEAYRERKSKAAVQTKGMPKAGVAKPTEVPPQPEEERKKLSTPEGRVAELTRRLKAMGF